MAAFSTIIGGIGLAASIGLGVAGLAAQAAGTAAIVEGNKQQSQASQRAEDLREKQMNLEAARQRRQVIRNVLRARSTALSGATAQGAATGSGIQGGFGQIGGQAAGNIQGIKQGTEIGAGIFEANRAVTRGAELASFGGGLSSLGGALFAASPTIGKLTSFASGQGSTG